MIRKNKSALMKATDLLSRRDQSEKILRQKLLARQYEEDEVDTAIDKLKKFNYLNDEETCARLFKFLYNEERLSVKQIQMKLIQRGYDSDFIKSLIPDDIYEHEYNTALKIGKKKFGGKISADIKFKQKIWQHLATKGFSSEIVGTVIEEILNYNDD